MSILGFSILYLVLGTIWAWYGLTVFYVSRHYGNDKVIYEFLTIAVNCLLFPLLMLIKYFVFFVRKESQVIQNDDGENVVEVEFGIMLEPLMLSGDNKIQTYRKTFGKKD